VSKYIIPIENLGNRYSVWLSALDFQYYLFFDELTEVPLDEIRTYVSEMYNNKIGKCTFGYYKLYGSRGYSTIKQGWALRQTGPLHDNYMKGNWPITKFKEMCAEPVQRIRTFETVIVLKTDYGHSPSNCNPGWNYGDGGFMRLSVDYHVYRRTEALKEKRYSYQHEDNWEYYNIPDGKDFLTYMPLNEDLSSVSQPSYVFPYTEQKHVVLKDICSTGKRLGEALQDLFEVKKLEGKFQLEFKK